MSKFSGVKKSTLALLLAGSAALAAAAGMAAMQQAGGGSRTIAAVGASSATGRPASTGAAAERHNTTYIVVYREAPLATYRGDVRGLAAPARLAARTGATGASGRGRVDVRSAAARAYVNHLARVQRGHESRIAATIGRAPAVKRRMQHALNAAVLELDQAEAARVRKLADVLLVEEYREYQQDTDVGPTLIGAPALWNASPIAFKGEGIVFGIIDSGINFGSPSFSATGGDGYAHVNPLGSGNYLGTCAPGGIDAGRCNDKLIGGYDFVCQAPGNTCGVANIREEPGFGDTNGHGSHTASIAAGNFRTAQFRGNDVPISGVAPHANIVAFDACYTNIATGQGLCPNVSTAASVDQAIADGVVDVINYSIGGGSQPWSEVVSLAFLNATDAGIYVATSAGNSGPGPNTMGHLEPWTGSTAAATHGREDYAFLLEITSPAPVPEPLSAIMLNEGTGAVLFSASLPGDTPVRVSPGFDTADDGCAAYPAGAMQGAIAVIRRGTCPFTQKGANAAAAGAVAMVIANNVDGGIVPSVPGVTIPVFGITKADGDALRDFAATAGAMTGGIAYPATRIPNTPDVLGSFSSRGPAGNFDLIKPDLTAPGVSVLAAYAGAAISGSENVTALLNGTSMASPHHAGAAGLLRQARPDWTVPEIKSALQMTAEQEVYKEDSVTPADAFAMGAGRVQVDRALRTGLVLHETTADYLAANPATGGDPTSLNLASMGDRDCYRRCEFFRTFRNPTGSAINYDVRLTGLRGRVAPTSFRVPAGATRTLHVVIDTLSQPPDGSWRFGKVVLRPTTGNTPTLRLPVAVSVQPPAIAFVPAQLSPSLPAGSSTIANLRIDNVGGSALDYSVVTSGTGARVLANVARGAVSTGYRSTSYTDPATAGLAAQFAAEDFALAQTTRLTSLFTEGFTSSNQELPAVATSITWSVFPDDGGKPAGDPLTTPNLATWSYTSAPTAPGVSTVGRNIGLDLAAAGQDVSLAPGRYWLVVSVRTSLANRWVWFASESGSPPFMAASVSVNGVASGWAPVTDFAGLSMRITGLVPCGAPWIGPPRNAPSGVLEPDASRTLRFPIDAGGLTAGQYTGNICVASNDPNLPRAAAPVVLTVTP
jgi:hypothetical protein